MTSALSKSSDVYFYTMGQRLNALAGPAAAEVGPAPRPGPQDRHRHPRRVRRHACPTAPGAIALNAEEAACRKKKHHPCGIADGTNRPWTEGDEVNLAVGQGDLQATPLQMAVAYSALANGNRRVRPHLGVAVEDSGGRAAAAHRARRRRSTSTIDPAARQAILDGLHDAHRSTARRPTCGRAGTRTATRCSARPARPSALNRPNDQSWYVCFVNDPQRPIVVAVTVEDGGFGAEAAAPIARTIVSKWFDQPMKFIAGKSHTR